MENPFANYGAILVGDRFIGRKEALRVIESRVLKPKDAGNLAIIGEPRIGKSSLVHKAIMEKKEHLLSKKIIPIWVNIGTYNEPTVFFRSLVSICKDELENLGLITDKIDKSAQKALQDRLSWAEVYSKIQRFFEMVKREGYSIIVVFDEFDHARVLFKNEISAFQALRELSYRPEWKITFVTTSRRSIRDIEVQSGAISTFDGIFHKYYLSMFNENDMQEFCNKFTQIGINLTDTDKQQMQYYCGGHPYFNEMLGFEVVEMFFEKRCVDIEKSAQNLLTTFFDEFDKVVSLLKEDDSLNKLLQILFGPMLTAKRTDIDEFLRYGLIQKTKDGQYIAFSEHFHHYLSLLVREIDLWPLFTKTEKAVRALIHTKMMQKYGENWIEQVEKSKGNLKSIIEEARQKQAKDMKSFPNRELRNLLDYTYFAELFDFVSCEWNDLFKNIFQKDKNYWQQRFGFIAKVRNPMAHGRDDVLAEYEILTAEGYCKEILSIIT